MEEPVLRYRVPWTTGGIILGIAVLADLVEFLFALIVALSFFSDIVTVIAEGIIWLFLAFSRVSFLRGKKSTGRLIWFLVTTVIKLIPVLNGLPALSPDTWYNIVSSRSEDRLLFKQQQEQYAKHRAAQAAQEEALARYYAQQAPDDGLEAA